MNLELKIDYNFNLDDFKVMENIEHSYFPDENIRKQVAVRCVEEEQNMVYDFCDGVIELLDTLKAKNIPIAMVTSSDAVKMNHLWQQHPTFKSYFDTIIDAEKVVKSKPDPEGYLKAASEIGVNPENCIVFEDSYQGVKAGKSAGAYVVGITGTIDRCILETIADVVVESIKDINFDNLIVTLQERK